jgi:hypothetical protein
MIIDTFTDWAGVEMVVIDNGNGSFASMSKSTYDQQQAALSTPIVTSDE